MMNFILEENYLLMTFELLHDFVDDGRDVQAIHFREFFLDPSHLAIDQSSRYEFLEFCHF